MLPKVLAGIWAVVFVGLSAAADPPVLKELSPSPKVVPRPTDPIPVDVGKYRFFSVEGYAGTSVTWEVDGTSVGIKEVATPVTLFGLVQGQPEPGEYPVPAGAVIVWGKDAGETKVVAYGVVDGKAKRLLSMVFVVGPRPPPDPIPDPKPKPVPVPTGKLWGYVLVEETEQALATRGATLRTVNAYCISAGLKWREVDQNTVDAAGKTPADVATYVADAKRAGVPRLYVVDETGKRFWEGTPPATGAEWTTLLKRFGGK